MKTALLQPPSPLRFQARPRTRIQDALAATVPLVSGRCGIVTNLQHARFEAGLRKFHIYRATLERITLHAHRAFDADRRANPDAWVAQRLPGRKGHSLSLDRDKAFLASVGEAAERYAQVTMYDPGVLWVAPWRDVKAVAMDPRAVQLYDAREYALDSRFAPFSPERPMRWAWAHDLATSEAILVPAQFCWRAYNPIPEEPLLKAGTSSGWAAHTTLEEAVTKCLLENVERDAYVILWANRLALPLVDLETVRHPASRAILDALNGLGAQVHGAYSATDLGVPAFVVIVAGSSAAYAPLVVALGAGLDPEIGLLRALEEAVAVFAGATFLLRSGIKPPAERDVRELLDHVSYYLDPARRRQVEWMWSSPERVGMQDLPRCAFPHAKDEAMHLAGLFSKAGIPTYALDTTPDDVREAGWVTAKVLNPGACEVEFGNGLVGRACPRLYNAPVRMGRLERPREELNADVHPHS